MVLVQDVSIYHERDTVLMHERSYSTGYRTAPYGLKLSKHGRITSAKKEVWRLNHYLSLVESVPLDDQDLVRYVRLGEAKQPSPLDCW